MADALPSQPIVPTGPAIVGINLLWGSWNVIGFHAGLDVLVPFACRFQFKTPHEYARLFEGLVPTLNA